MIMEIRKETEKKKGRRKEVSTVANQRNLLLNYFVKDYSIFDFLKC